MADFFTLILHPTPSNKGYLNPKKFQGFLTENDAWDYYNRGQNYHPHFWERPQVVLEPLADPTNTDQLYVVVSPEGTLETGYHSSAVPKLYKLGTARAVANKNSKGRARRAPYRVVPVTLAFGAPV